MKYNKAVSSSRRTTRKAHFTAPSDKRRRLLSASLSKDLRSKYGVRSLPIRKDDEVQVVRGKYVKEPTAKVTSVYRRRMCVYLDRITKDRADGRQVHVPMHPSNLVITKLKLDKDRNAILKRRKAGREGAADKGKGKYSAGDVSGSAPMAEVD